MEDKILKQIEDEALKLYPVIMHSDSVFESERDINEFQRHFWTEGAKYGYNIKESVDKKLDELLPAVENIIYRSLQDLLTDSNTERSDCAAIDVIDYLKLHLSASQNTERNECDTPCGMNYCDENGCTNRKRNLVEPIELPKENTVSNEGEKLDFYAMDLNSERIKTYTALSERYNLDISSIRDIFCAGLDFVAGKYEALLSAAKNTVSNEGEKWVSVDDRLPKAYETIISYNIHTDEVSTDYIDNDKRWDVLNPTHWMPLPNPPKDK